MPPRKKTSFAAAALPVDEQVQSALAALKGLATTKYRDGLKRFAIPADKALGVPMAQIQRLGRQLGRSHELAAALWETDVYEARLLAAYVDEPKLVTLAQMDRWAREFDNWAICDTVCFALFDRTPHAWRKIDEWSDRREEFVKRAAFAMLAGLTVYDKKAEDALFLHGLQLVERAATDERNFVKKAVNWALRSVGKRNLALHAPALQVAERLGSSPDRAARWVGKGALKELTSAAVLARLETRSRRS